MADLWRSAQPEDGEQAVEYDCWIWTGPVDVAGWPRATHDGRRMPAARAVWEQETRQFPRKIPQGWVLQSLCGTRLCVRPRHHRPIPRSEYQRMLRTRRETEKLARVFDAQVEANLESLRRVIRKSEDE